jgi:hypothetical protein
MTVYTIEVDVDYNEKEGRYYAQVVAVKGAAAVLEDTVVPLEELPKVLEDLGRAIKSEWLLR